MTNPEASTPGGDESRVPVQPRNYLRPCLLLLLEEAATYGYELRHKLAPLSAGNFDPGTVYRALNTMEDDGLVRSTWERSAEGPRRRLYEITGDGSAVLDGLTRELCGLRTMVNEFIERYESHHPSEDEPFPPQHVTPAGADTEGPASLEALGEGYDTLVGAVMAVNGHRAAVQNGHAERDAPGD